MRNRVSILAAQTKFKMRREAARTAEGNDAREI
jgi:hypothetical protein